MKSVLIAAAFLAVASPALADVTFTDSNMALSDYRTTTYAGPGIDVAQFNVVGLGGFGTALTTQSTSNYLASQGTQPARFQFLNTNFVYDPSADGEILSVESSMYQRLLINAGERPVNLTNALQVLRVLAEQDGRLYEASFITAGGSHPYNQYVEVARTGISASDFLFFDPQNPWATRTATGLDFAGGAITFGFELAYYRLTAGSGLPDTSPVLAQFTVDDFSLTLRTADPVSTAVPEPGAWALMILGFGAAGAAIRHSRRRALPIPG